MSDPRLKADRLSSYLKALSSSYGLFVANIGIYAITVPLILKWLGPERYGIWLIFLQLVYIVSLATTWIATPIVREAATCYVEANQQLTQRLFQTTSIYYLLLGTVTVTFTMLGSQFVPELFKIAPEMRAEVMLALMLLSVYIASSMQLSLLVSLFIGFQQMHMANLLFGALTVLGTSLGVGAVAEGWGLLGLAAGQVAAVMVMYAIGWWLSHRIHRISWGLAHFNRQLIFNLLRSGTGYVGYHVSFLLLQSDILLVGIIIGPISAAAYGVAYKLMDYAVQLIWRIPDSLLPMIAELDLRQKGERLRQVHRLSGRVAVAAAFLFAIVISIYGHSGLLLWLGAENATPPVVLAAFGILIVLQVLVHSSLVISFGTNRMRSIAGIALIEGIIKVSISIVLLPRIGVIGVAIGTLVAQICLTAWYVPLRACTITADTLFSYLSTILSPALPAAVCSSIVGVASLLVMSEAWLRLLVGCPITVIIYILIYLARGVDMEQRNWMIMRFQRVLQS
jgi:O-antigen/teichoic acid export membrane protein